MFEPCSEFCIELAIVTARIVGVLREGGQRA